MATSPQPEILSMRVLPLLALLIGAAAPPASAPAAAGPPRPAPVERTLKKEPAYRSRAPRYCLLVFGAGAKTHVWVVLDGDTLYIDRNGNGDLTEKGEQVKIKLRDTRAKKGPAFNWAETDLGPVTAKDGVPRGTRLELRFSWNPVLKQEEVSFAMKVGGKTRQFTTGQENRNARKCFRFGATARKAPVVHFNGPLTLDLMTRFMSRPDGHLHVTVGTPGRGPGTFAHVSHEDGAVPEGLSARVELTYPARKGGRPIKKTAVLKERC
jgi:hypothetical protein